MLLKPEKIRSKKIRDSAEGEPCTFRKPNVCNGDPSTTVFAHLEGNKGTATKNHDLFGIYVCSDCHDFIDGRHTLPFEAHHYKDLLRALQETLIKLYQKGLIEVS